MVFLSFELENLDQKLFARQTQCSGSFDSTEKKSKETYHMNCTVLYCTVLYCTVLYCTVRGTLYSNYVYFSLVIPASISLSFYLSLFSFFLSFNYVFIVKLPTHSLLLINSCISQIDTFRQLIPSFQIFIENIFKAQRFFDKNIFTDYCSPRFICKRKRR